MLSNSEVAVFCEQSGMILESGLSMLEGISIMEEDVEPHNTEYKKMYEDMRMCLEETGIFHEALTKTGLFPSYFLSFNDSMYASCNYARDGCKGCTGI